MIVWNDVFFDLLKRWHGSWYLAALGSFFKSDNILTQVDTFMKSDHRLSTQHAHVTSGRRHLEHNFLS